MSFQAWEEWFAALQRGWIFLGDRVPYPFIACQSLDLEGSNLPPNASRNTVSRILQQTPRQSEISTKALVEPWNGKLVLSSATFRNWWHIAQAVSGFDARERRLSSEPVTV